MSVTTTASKPSKLDQILAWARSLSPEDRDALREAALEVLRRKEQGK